MSIRIKIHIGLSKALPNQIDDIIEVFPTRLCLVQPQTNKDRSFLVGIFIRNEACNLGSVQLPNGFSFRIGSTEQGLGRQVRHRQ